MLTTFHRQEKSFLKCHDNNTVTPINKPINQLRVPQSSDYHIIKDNTWSIYMALMKVAV